jgi:hypothetical protein
MKKVKYNQPFGEKYVKGDIMEYEDCLARELVDVLKVADYYTKPVAKPVAKK